MRFASPTYMWPDMMSSATGLEEESGKVEVHGQMGSLVADTRAAFRRPFDGLVPATSCVQTGVTMGEEVSSWPELLKRYHVWFPATPGTGWSMPSGLPWDLRKSDLSQWGYHKKNWLLHRGKLRFKNLMLTDTYCDYRTLTVWQNQYNSTAEFFPVTVSDFARASSLGLAVTDSDQTPISEVEQPFYYDFNFISTGMQLGRERLPNVGMFGIALGVINLAPTCTKFISVGDDYTCGWPLPPQPLYWPLVPAALETGSTNNNNSESAMAQTFMKNKASGNPGSAQVGAANKARRGQ